MPDIMNRLMQNAAERASRRGFLGTMGKVTAGLTAIIVGETLTSGKASANNCPICPGSDFCDNSPASCCDSTYPSCGAGCPDSSYVDSYTWLCCDSHRTMICYDCDSTCTGEVVCSYARLYGYNNSPDVSPNYVPC